MQVKQYRIEVQLIPSPSIFIHSPSSPKDPPITPTYSSMPIIPPPIRRIIPLYTTQHTLATLALPTLETPTSNPQILPQTVLSQTAKEKDGKEKHTHPLRKTTNTLLAHKPITPIGVNMVERRHPRPVAVFKQFYRQVLVWVGACVPVVPDPDFLRLVVSIVDLFQGCSLECASHDRFRVGWVGESYAFLEVDGHFDNGRY
ncbi:hypothetical protein BJX62DRAFT_218789 [Aspergillus germanicus]